jgi:hypothetical protein
VTRRKGETNSRHHRSNGYTPHPIQKITIEQHDYDQMSGFFWSVTHAKKKEPQGSLMGKK